MGYLRQIILIHTYLEGVVELLLDADANICGSNATGKTTLQRLIPVFYGELPNRVVPRTRQNFHEFYLPHTNSYIIYEYVREAGDTVMAVLLRDSQGGVEYRFIDAPYAPEFFLDQTEEGPKGVAFQEVARRVRQQGVELSVKLSATSEYRSVLQNDFSQLRSTKQEQHRLFALAAKFSLAGANHRLRHMEKLVSAVHAKEGKMDTLKTMLAAIFEEDGVALPVTRLRNQEARQWISKMRQSMQLSEFETLFEQCQNQAHELAHTEAGLLELTPVLKQDMKQLTQTKADALAKAQQLQQQLDALKANYEEEREALRDKKLEREQALNLISRRLQDIQERYDHYLNADMEALARDMEMLPSWREQWEQQKSHVKLLEEEYGHKEQAYLQQQATLSQYMREQHQQAAKRKDDIRHTIDVLIKEQQQQKEQEQARYLARREEIQQNFSQQQARLGQEISEVLTELRGTLRRPVDDERLQEASLRVERYQQESMEAERRVSRCKEALHRKQQQHQEALQAHRALRKTMAQQEEALYDLQQQFEPQKGTLRHFLREELPGWEQHLGKLIREELLHRTDLAPRLGGEPEQFSGLVVDTHLIESPPFALEEEALVAAVAEAAETLAQLQEQVDNEAQGLKQQEAEVRQLAEKVAEAEHLAEQAAQEVLFATQAREALQQEIQAKVKQRRAQLQNRQQELEERQAQLAEAQQQQLNALEKDFQQKRLELNADYEDNLHREQERLRAVDEHLAQQEADTTQRLAELKAQFEAELKQEGVDVEVIAQAKARATELEQRIQATEKRRDELQEYRDFLRLHWAQKPELVAQETTLENQVREAEQALSTAQHSYQHQRHDIRRTLEQCHQEAQHSEQHIATLTPLLGRLAELSLPETPLPEVKPIDVGEQGERIERARHGLEQRAKQEQQLRQGLNQFHSALLQGADDSFREVLAQSRERLEKIREGQAPHVLDELAPYGYILTLLRNEQTELLQHGRNIGGDLHKFFTVFRDLNRRIHAQSRRLSEEVAHEMHLDGISRAEVKIESTIDQLDFWVPLKRFSELHQEWIHSGEEVPSEDYLDALAQVAELLRQDQQYRFEHLMQLELHLTENGRSLVIRNDRQLLESSSHGMAYLILCQFLLAFTRLLRGAAQVKIHWPIDEIGTLAYGNVEQLFQACAANHIVILGAFPNPESDVLGLFTHRYLIEKEGGTEIRRLKRIEPRLSPLEEKLMAQQEALA